MDEYEELHRCLRADPEQGARLLGAAAEVGAQQHGVGELAQVLAQGEQPVDGFGAAAREAVEQTMEELRELQREAASQIVVPKGGGMPPGGLGGAGGGGSGRSAARLYH